MHDTTEIDRCYRILGLPFGAPREEVRRAYRDLARVWHPDRFPGDPRLQHKAQENLRRINEAYARLKNYEPPEVPADRDAFGDEVVGLGEVIPSPRGSEVVLEAQEISDDEVDQAIDALVSAPAPRADEEAMPRAPAADPVDLTRPRPGHRVTGFDPVGLDQTSASAPSSRGRWRVLAVIALAILAAGAAAVVVFVFG